VLYNKLHSAEILGIAFWVALQQGVVLGLAVGVAGWPFGPFACMNIQ